MVNACRAIIRFTDGMNLEDYLNDDKTRYAVMRGFEILGKAVRHLPDELKVRHPHIPWVVMAAVRNRIVHGYSGSMTRLFSQPWRLMFKRCFRNLRPWHSRRVLSFRS
jgi:uncharacterized protein with HEPN domain